MTCELDSKSTEFRRDIVTTINTTGWTYCFTIHNEALKLEIPVPISCLLIDSSMPCFQMYSFGILLDLRPVRIKKIASATRDFFRSEI